MTDPRHALLGFVPDRAHELRERNAEQDVDENMTMQQFASSKVVPLEDLSAQKCWTSAREKGIRMLS